MGTRLVPLQLVMVTMNQCELTCDYSTLGLVAVHSHNRGGNYTPQTHAYGRLYPPPRPFLLHPFSATTLVPAVLLAGQPATGKTAALQTVVSALNARGPSDRGTNTSVKMLRIFPGMCGDPAELYGNVSPSSGDWVDGIFTSIFRKAHKVHMSYCVCSVCGCVGVWV